MWYGETSMYFFPPQNHLNIHFRQSVDFLMLNMLAYKLINEYQRDIQGVFSLIFQFYLWNAFSKLSYVITSFVPF